MRIDLTSYNTTEGSKIRIYRSYTEFSTDMLPEILAELDYDALEYLDNTVELNRIVYYRIGILHNLAETVGPLYTTMKRYYTGPQVTPGSVEPDMVLRGDAKVGRYGAIPLASIIPIDKIPTDFPGLPLMPGINYNDVLLEKCIFEGKILFIPNQVLVQGSLSALYNAGILFPSGDGKVDMTPALYSSIETKVNQGRKVQGAGFTFRFRLMTVDEWLRVYTKLYPSSKVGSVQERVIANCIPHNYASPVIQPSLVADNDNLGLDLDFNITSVAYTDFTPLYMVLELVGRSDTAFPDLDGEVLPTLPEDRMMYCNSEFINGRVHYFGGIYSRFNTGSEATTRHISFDENGENEIVHASMPFGVYKSVTWVANNKIYCFGGVRKIGTTEWSFDELYNDVQVWEDNGTPEGVWTVLTSNVTYGFDSCGTVYYDTTTQKNLLLVLGGYQEKQPGITNNYYWADVATFDGTFSTAISTVGTNYSGGGAMHEYENAIMMTAGTRLANGYTSTSRKRTLPFNPPASLYMSAITTQGNELPATKAGRMHVWRDTLIYVTSASIDQAENKLFFYQWAPNESRWLKILVNTAGIGSDTRASISVSFNQNRVYMLLCYPWLNESYTSKLVIVDLVDPLDAPLGQINEITPIVERIYPPYAKVVKP